MRSFRLLHAIAVTAIAITASAQDSLVTKLEKYPGEYCRKIDSKIEAFESRSSKEVAKSLNKIYAIEKKIYRKLLKTDSMQAVLVYGDFEEQYHKAFALLEGKKKSIARFLPQQYAAYLDTLKNTIGFFKKNSTCPEAANTLNNFARLEDKLANIEQLKFFFRQRRQLLQTNLSKYKVFGEQLSKLNKEVFYYQKVISELKADLKDPVKIERRALSLLRKIPLFDKFIRENSWLSNGGAGIGPQIAQTSNNLPAGIQSRAAIMDVLQTRLSAGSVDPAALIRQQLQATQGSTASLPGTVQLPDKDFDDIQPDFKINHQKGKKFWKRIEYGTNLQFSKPNNFLPNTSDLGLSLGYKLSDDGIIGLGVTYKLGLGSGWNNIKFTHQGIGVRSYIDWKLKKIFYLSGGLEKNYNAQFQNISQLQTYSAWQTSGMIGLSTKYNISRKVKSKAQLLFDFLYKQNIPNTRPLVFRIGWTL